MVIVESLRSRTRLNVSTYLVWPAGRTFYGSDFHSFPMSLPTRDSQLLVSCEPKSEKILKLVSRWAPCCAYRIASGSRAFT